MSDSFPVLSYSSSPLSPYTHSTSLFSITKPKKKRGLWSIDISSNILKFFIETNPCNFQTFSANPKRLPQILLHLHRYVMTTSNKNRFDISQARKVSDGPFGFSLSSTICKQRRQKGLEMLFAHCEMCLFTVS